MSSVHAVGRDDGREPTPTALRSRRMCGICGVVQLGGEARPVLEPGVLDRMTDAMAHRGPSDRGTYVADGVALGARRLTLSTSKPVISHSPTRTERSGRHKTARSTTTRISGPPYTAMDTERPLGATPKYFHTSTSGMVRRSLTRCRVSLRSRSGTARSDAWC